jgi:GST-like protein
VARRHTVGLVERVYPLLDARLGATRFLAGDDYSISDIAAFPWGAKMQWAERTLDDRPHLARWFADIAARPPVIRGMNVPAGVTLD